MTLKVRVITRSRASVHAGVRRRAQIGQNSDNKPTEGSFSRAVTASLLFLIRSSTCCVVQFPSRTQITFGGNPRSTLRSPKSESFVTIVYPSCRARSHTWSSDARSIPNEKTCEDSGCKSASRLPIGATGFGQTEVSLCASEDSRSRSAANA